MKKLKDIEIMKKVYKLLNEIELICVLCIIAA